MKSHNKGLQDLLLKLFLIVSLFFPAFYSIFDADYLAEYFVGPSAAYMILVLYLSYQLVKLRTMPEGKSFWIFLGIIILYNAVSYYFNVKYLHWYWEQINNTIAFFLLLFLLGYGVQIQDETEKLISFFIKAVTCSNILSLIYFAAGYTSFIICNNHPVFYRATDDIYYYEFRHYWLYSHKSDYSVMLLCFLAVCLCYRKEFKKKYGFWITMAVLGAALVTTHSWTGYVAGVILVAAAVLDCMDMKKLLKSRRGKLAMSLAAASGALAGVIMLSQRDLSTIGDRLPIWRAVAGVLKERPQGLGLRFGEYPILTEKGFTVTNAHNVFLNQMLRFSVPAGIIFTVLILMIAGYCIYKSRTWMSLGLWVGLLLLFNMDYSLLNYEVAMVLLCAYFVCIFPRVSKKREAVGDEL